MAGNEKRPFQRVTAGRAAEMMACGASFSNVQCTTADGERQAFFVASLLPQGEANAVPSRELARLAGFRRVRDLQRAIERERQRGAIILSAMRGGYFRPDGGERGRQEISAFVKTLDARARKTQLSLRSARRALRECSSQEVLTI